MKTYDNKDHTIFPEGHMVLLYSNEKEVINIVVSYIKSNLEKSIRCIYITGDADTKLIINNLKRLVDYDNYIQKEQLFFIDKEESYSKDGCFDPDRMIEMLINETNLAKKAGYEGLAVTGEISWALNFNDGFEKIMEYEIKLNDLVFSNHPISSICRYNLNKFSDDMILNIIQVHPYIIWQNILHENPFYIPVEGYKENQIKKYLVSSLLQNLKEFTNEKDNYKSDIKRKEQELIESERDLLESQRIARLGTWRLNVKTNQVVWSDELYGMYGFDPTLPPPPYTEHMKLFTPASWDKLSTALERTRTLGIPYELELETVVKDGTNGWMWVRGEAEKDINGNIVTIRGAAQDVTDRKKREEERFLLEAHITNQQKLESIGTLASGVAHEINNPINGILNYGQVIFDSTESGSEINKFAEEIIYETNRVSEIVSNLLDFSRQSGKQHSYAQINDILKKTLSLVNTIFKHDNINLNIDVSDNISKLKCRSQQVQQVLMNLLTNARDSLNEKYPGYHENKKINIECREFSKDNRKWVYISIEDFGIGIPADNRNRIFDPFFTTKEKNAGTGLGLSISYGIVKEHHGEIDFDSKEGEYTKFTLILPCDNGWDIK